MSPRELIDRYTYEVARQLPSKSRSDIRQELDSLLTEALERQAEKAGQEPDEAMTVALLKEFGSPSEMASSYRGEEYLIGPVLFPTFKMVVSIVLSVVVGIQVIIFAINALWGSMEMTPLSMGESLAGIVSSAFGSFVIVVIIFALLERMPANRVPEKETWNPRSLPPVKDPNRIAPVELALGIIFPLLAIILFNRYPYWIVDMEAPPGGFQFFPVLHQNFLNFVPWLTASWALEIGLRSIVLAQGRWSLVTRVAEFLVEMFGLYVTYLIFSGGPITFNSGIDMIVRFGLGIAIVVGAISAVFTLGKSLLANSGASEASIRSRMA
jgi:hypothetical protein